MWTSQTNGQCQTCYGIFLLFCHLDFWSKSTVIMKQERHKMSIWSSFVEIWLVYNCLLFYLETIWVIWIIIWIQVLVILLQLIICHSDTVPSPQTSDTFFTHFFTIMFYSFFIFQRLIESAANLISRSLLDSRVF